MTFKQAVFERPASQEQPGLQEPASPKPQDDVSGRPPTVSLENREAVTMNLSSIISDEILRHRIRALVDEKPKDSRLKAILNHSLFIAVIIAVLGFVLTVVLGSRLTYWYTVQQQELASQRSFSDELNKIRVQKIGEVWELVDKNEIALDDLLEKARSGVNLSPAEKTKDVDTISSLIREDRVVISKNRFWLGEENYARLLDYLDKNKRTALNMLLAHPSANFDEIIRERKDAKQDILQIRESMRVEGQARK